MPTLLCFGDSNTWGAPATGVIGAPGLARRFGPGVRWPSVCARALGEGWELVEEGLPGRTAQFEDPVMGAHMDGRPALRMALNSHGPLDVLAIMLGTNDAKCRFAPTPKRITAGIAGLVDVARSRDQQDRHGGFSILLICPPIVEEVGPFAAEFHGATEAMTGLAEEYAALAHANGCGFLDANDVIKVSPLDGIHFNEPEHDALGQAVAKAILAL
ncbi:SGNH/GDSL hydrolase family protein [Pelagovum pacificum]|uniref:Lipolytic enzyme, G-D-S-L n=1 Tax=Pelagovum pacificum TaxID=2588711 RepID=A0A5C5GJX1_9RHOB|nr:SGNH/GDSL hydrolase family protein [Pelagovum pacificum]QQA43091.1 SGNH/GDSL hydrolase family protein [Pelagovum pacificum]TNY33766.1 lipolytic enzyme, G-D-S-L [Pelagovum pacificum]